MSGYVPVFGSVFTGTLHGKWPDVGLWLCILGMADRNGVVDCTPQYIASVIGLGVFGGSGPTTAQDWLMLSGLAHVVV